jgi:hypothetical protein
MTDAVDRIGQPVKVGSPVAFPISASMIGIGRVEKITPKQFKIKPINYSHFIYKNQSEIISLDDNPKIIEYLLSQ